jgi:hypothetical protein
LLHRGKRLAALGILEEISDRTSDVDAYPPNYLPWLNATFLAGHFYAQAALGGRAEELWTRALKNVGGRLEKQYFGNTYWQWGEVQVMLEALKNAYLGVQKVRRGREPGAVLPHQLPRTAKFTFDKLFRPIPQLYASGRLTLTKAERRQLGARSAPPQAASNG